MHIILTILTIPQIRIPFTNIISSLSRQHWRTRQFRILDILFQEPNRYQFIPFSTLHLPLLIKMLCLLCFFWCKSLLNLVKMASSETVVCLLKYDSGMGRPSSTPAGINRCNLVTCSPIALPINSLAYYQTCYARLQDCQARWRGGRIGITDCPGGWCFLLVGSLQRTWITLSQTKQTWPNTWC